MGSVRELARDRVLRRLVTLTLVLALTAAGMSSFERYAGSAVPLLVAVALLTSERARQRVTLGVAPVVLCACAVQAFLHRYVP